ncbi:MAG: hypothetical protein K8T89_05535 [Planctomycetes bacterium]|nr:hypothetical protein [Planctomycetota bacterium]
MSPQFSLSMFSDKVSAVEADYLRRFRKLYDRVAKNVAALKADGWTTTYLFHLVTAQHPEVRTPAQALRRLAKIGIDPKDLKIEIMPTKAQDRRLRAKARRFRYGEERPRKSAASK